MRGYIFDLDGTICRGDHLIPGARECLAFLDAEALPYVFATNHTNRSSSELCIHLKRLGLQVDEEHVVTATTALLAFIDRDAHVSGAARVHLIGRGGIAEELASAGIVLTADRPDYAVIGWDPECNYESLRSACAAVRGGAKLVVTSPDRYIPSDRGWELGMGSIGAAVQYATGAAPNYVGKPYAPMIDIAVTRMALAHADVAIVGDTLESDIESRSRNGLGASILVLSGNADRADIDRAPAEQLPTHVIGSLVDLPGLIQRQEIASSP